jgi:hypothetical protein
MVASADHDSSESCCVDDVVHIPKATQITTRSTTKATIKSTTAKKQQSKEKKQQETARIPCPACSCRQGASWPLLTTIEAKIVVSTPSFPQSKAPRSIQHPQKNNNQKRKTPSCPPLIFPQATRPVSWCSRPQRPVCLCS